MSTILSKIRFIRVSLSAVSASRANKYCTSCVFDCILIHLKFITANNNQKILIRMEMYSIPDFFKIRNDKRRNARFRVLLTTTYSLNNFLTKTIHVRLQRTNKGIFKLLVKLSGHNADGIYFDTDCWQ